MHIVHVVSIKYYNHVSSTVTEVHQKACWALIRNTAVSSLYPCPCLFFSLLDSLNDFEILFSTLLFASPRLWAFSTIESCTPYTWNLRGSEWAWSSSPCTKMGGAGSFARISSLHTSVHTTAICSLVAGGSSYGLGSAAPAV